MWQDSKLGPGNRFQTMGQLTYFDKTVEAQGACVSFTGLPVHSSTMGQGRCRRLRAPDYHCHCQAIMSSKRADVTDDRNGLMFQCLQYIYEAFIETGSMNRLSEYLIDSALIAWDLRPRRCSNFNFALLCSVLDEIDCYSDRDQVSFPYAMHKMNLRRVKRRNHVIFVDAVNDTIVQIVDNRCHWYFTENDDRCVEASVQSERLAVLVAGSLHHFHLRSTLKHLFFTVKDTRPGGGCVRKITCSS